ncbi:hypothetical protein AAZX31_14G184800 [Glycine max]|uniref:uncharacterized protein n=1 Tax=Glycine max TaxID=3847 RepID=UPI000296DEEB|nr:uncharacterized protein LOC102667375 [Glycine max]XP_040865012.1 uncharacterized protein LOC102667375 [Glycine max]XP_040865013.1 uncharacterized protein LOC102667375 [Glycine max]XP_040865014.1 uncharacterized protein LOC102667375 [Glycine max]KAG4382958.1 hypothetical protein GLYMA_14G199700v4 [Glycine max]KAG4382959.1 hypothetical protein GLYMA_14G199700v4 [Glycine max]KAG4382960.1 hypothetical protein GLYMA_14G199700v4 [Glycine max]
MTSLTIQMARWLKKEAVWRYVGFVSTILGLLCYGLSSSFNSLFGEWSLLKIFLYSVFSLFICLWSLFPKVWQYSTSLRLKAHLAFLVLTITSVYSYFADKVVNRKPDAYSLISSAAFAIVSLSLSRQTECGFEVDFLYFFLGCLIVQLLKIKLALVIVGVGFSYALIILRSSLYTTPYQNLGVQDEHSVVIDVNSLRTDNASIMPQLMTCIRALPQGNSNVTNMLSKLVKEYLEDNSKPVVIDSNFVIDALPWGKINDLRKTIKLVIGVGFAQECYEVYCNWRRESLKECLINLLGLPEINVEKSRLLAFEDYILRRRIKAIQVALRTLIPSERRLCDSVFEGFSSLADLCFTDICRGTLMS